MSYISVRVDDAQTAGAIGLILGKMGVPTFTANSAQVLSAWAADQAQAEGAVADQVPQEPPDGPTLAGQDDAQINDPPLIKKTKHQSDAAKQTLPTAQAGTAPVKTEVVDADDQNGGGGAAGQAGNAMAKKGKGRKRKQTQRSRSCDGPSGFDTTMTPTNDEDGIFEMDTCRRSVRQIAISIGEQERREAHVEEASTSRVRKTKAPRQKRAKALAVHENPEDPEESAIPEMPDMETDGEEIADMEVNANMDQVEEEEFLDLDGNYLFTDPIENKLVAPPAPPPSLIEAGLNDAHPDTPVLPETLHIKKEPVDEEPNNTEIPLDGQDYRRLLANICLDTPNKGPAIDVKTEPVEPAPQIDLSIGGGAPGDANVEGSRESSGGSEASKRQTIGVYAKEAQIASTSKGVGVGGRSNEGPATITPPEMDIVLPPVPMAAKDTPQPNVLLTITKKKPSTPRTPTPRTPSSAKGLFNCDVCSRPYRTSAGLLMHQGCHSAERPYDCPECGKQCSNSFGLKRHSKTHKK